MTKIEAIKEHLALREQFWGKYNIITYAYGFVICLFHKQELIEHANKGLRQWIADYDTASKLREQL